MQKVPSEHAQTVEFLLKLNNVQKLAYVESFGDARIEDIVRATYVSRHSFEDFNQILAIVRGYNLSTGMLKNAISRGWTCYSRALVQRTRFDESCITAAVRANDITAFQMMASSLVMKNTPLTTLREWQRIAKDCCYRQMLQEIEEHIAAHIQNQIYESTPAMEW